MNNVDAKWFREKIGLKNLTQRQFGEKLGMDPSSTSLMLKGKRAVTIDRAASMAKILGVSLEEVCQHAGVNPNDAIGDRIKIGGSTTVKMLAKPVGWTISPGNLPNDSIALVLRTTQTELDMLNGWVAFIGPHDENISDAVDRTAVVKIMDNPDPMMRLIRRGAAPALYTLTGIGQPPIHDVQIEWMRPVLLFRPV